MSSMIFSQPPVSESCAGKTSILFDDDREQHGSVTMESHTSRPTPTSTSPATTTFPPPPHPPSPPLSKNQLRKQRVRERKLAARRAARASEHLRRRRRDAQQQRQLAMGAEREGLPPPPSVRQRRQQQQQRLLAVHRPLLPLAACEEAPRRPAVCIDLGALDDCSSPYRPSAKQLSRLRQQLVRVYGANRRAQLPWQLLLTSCTTTAAGTSSSSSCCDQFLAECRRCVAGFDSYVWHVRAESANQLFTAAGRWRSRHSRLVYLCPDAGEELDSVGDDDVLVIGAVVDETVVSGVQLARAAAAAARAEEEEKEGGSSGGGRVCVARLPLSRLCSRQYRDQQQQQQPDENDEEQQQSDEKGGVKEKEQQQPDEKQKELCVCSTNEEAATPARLNCVLTVNQVFDALMISWQTGGDWQRALRHTVPQRKLQQLLNNKNNR